VAFLHRCRSALKPNGVLALKENNCRAPHASEFDEEDASITRSDEELKRLFAVAGLLANVQATQTGFPAGAYAIRMYHLELIE